MRCVDLPGKYVLPSPTPRHPPLSLPPSPAVREYVLGERDADSTPEYRPIPPINIFVILTYKNFTGSSFPSAGRIQNDLSRAIIIWFRDSPAGAAVSGPAAVWPTE